MKKGKRDQKCDGHNPKQAFMLFPFVLTIGARMRPSNKSSLKRNKEDQSELDKEQVLLLKVSIELFLVSGILCIRISISKNSQMF